jgi:two-component system sensor histidine kinase KdpD
MASRGTLRVYLGMAPGVGKTFAMLDEGKRRRERGADVLVGVVETHGRVHTQEKLTDMTILPRKEMLYAGRTFTEMDLDAILARHPQIVLVDELAHTNITGSKNEKRWQDVEEILAAGIDVISTVNIQHLESIHDVVEKITGIAQAETIPDLFLRQADQVEIVDITPEALHRRMVHGNIYKADKIDAALNNYFRIGNLSALRELALLWVADKVEEGLQKYRKDEGISDIWESQEKIVIAVNDAPEAETIIKRAARIAARSPGAKLFAVHILKNDGIAVSDASALTRIEKLVVSLGGSFHEISSEDISTSILDFARSVNATQVVLGVTSKGRWTRLLQGESIASKVTRLSEEIDVHLVTHEGARQSKFAWKLERSTLGRTRIAQAFGVMALLLPLSTWLLTLTRGTLNSFSDGLVFLLVNSLISLIGGFIPATVSTLFSVALLNYYFIPPIHTFTISEHNNLIALIIFFFVAFLIASLVESSARRQREALRASKESSLLSMLASQIIRGDAGMAGLLDHTQKALGFNSLRLEYDSNDGKRQAIGDIGVSQDPATKSFTWRINDTLKIAGDGRLLTASDSRILEALASQLDLIWSSEILAAKADAATEISESDRMRTALLNAVSHDLRGPLASALASVASLRNEEVSWSDSDRSELLGTAASSLERLKALIENLLDMSRLQAGSLAVHLQEVSIYDVLPTALKSIAAQPDAIELIEGADVSDIRTDPGLLERVLANLIDNALSHGKSGKRPQISISEHDEEVQVRIIDYGKGIESDLIDVAFAPFKRLGDVDNGRGVGLGLALSHGLSEAIGARLSLVETPGGGLTAIIDIPTAAVPLEKRSHA